MKIVNPIYLFIFVISQILFISCENEIPFKTKNVTRQLVISSLMNADNQENKIWLNITGVEKVTPVTDGEINIYVNGELKETLYANVPERDWMDKNEYLCNLKFSPGDQIKIEASTKGGEFKASAETTVPHPLEMEKIDTLTVPSSNGYNFFRVRPTFTDDPDKKNFYRILIDKYYTVYGTTYESEKDTSFIFKTPATVNNREDVVLTEGRPGSINDDNDFAFTQYDNVYNIFNDARLNGQYTMTTFIDMYPYYPYLLDINPKRVSLEIKVRLLSLCEAQYYYLRTLNTFDSFDYDEVLSPPIIFYSNVTGGTGIFGISTETSRTISIFKDQEIGMNSWQ